MSALVALSVACAAATVEVSLAPDQPVSQVYVDDPLIIEFKSDEDTAATVRVDLEPDYPSPPVALDLGSLNLRAHGALWKAVEGAPPLRGRYRVKTHLDLGGMAAETQGVFCRVDRPVANYILPVCAAFDPAQAGGVDPRALLALGGASVRCVRLDAGMPDAASRAEEVESKGFQLVVGLDATQRDACESLAKSFGDRVVRWEIDPGGAADAFSAMVKALRRGGAKAPVALVVRDARTLSRLLEAGAGQFANAAALRCSWPARVDITAMRAAAERAGYEAMVMYAAAEEHQPDDARLARRVVQHVVAGFAAGVTQTDIPADWIYASDIGPAYVALCALAHRLNGASYVGELDLGENVQALGFRAGPQWMLVIWTSEGATDVSLKLENVTESALFDARGNLLDAPPLKDGAVALHVTGEPQFWTGKGGSFLFQVAQTVVRRKAVAFIESEDVKKCFSPELMEAVGKFARLEATGYSRIDFFSLLKLFPRIEELWHTGGARRSVAVPALAGLSRLARALCVLEQERGEPFVEPLQKTLANCGQFQSLYLTSSAGASETRERPDWLLERVGQLMAEAEQLAAEGRTVEASSVATLAEWRARALEIAAKAQPLSAPEREAKPPEMAQPALVKEEKPGEAALEKKPAKKPKKSAGTETRTKSTKRKRQK